MSTPETLVSLFYNFLNETSRRKILDLTNIKDDRPSLLRGHGGGSKEAYEWMQFHRERIAPLIFRFVDPPDRLLQSLVDDGDFQIPILKEIYPGNCHFHN